MKLFNTGNTIGMVDDEFINIDSITVIQKGIDENDEVSFNIHLGANDHYVELNQDKFFKLMELINEQK